MLTSSHQRFLVPLGGFLFVDGVDAFVVFVGVVRWLDGCVLSLLARLLPRRVHREDAIDAHNLGPLVDRHGAQHSDHRPVGELGLLHFEALLPLEREDPVAGVHRPVPVPRAAGHEHVDPTEQALGLLLDLVRDAVTLHRGLDVADHGAVRDLGPPAGRRSVLLVGVEGIVVADPHRPVADGIRRRHREQLSAADRRVETEQ